MSAIQEHDVQYSLFEDYLYHHNASQPDGYVGCLGFPSAASAEKGGILTARMVERMLADYRKIL
jgi:creatinine amidohydrolase